MGLETAPTRSLTVEPKHLIAAADPNLVTPTAVDALTSAFRSGAITSDDITQRHQQVQKNKIDLENAQQEQAFNSDPQVMEARKHAAIAHGSIAKAEQARAESSLKLAPLAEELDRSNKVVAIFNNDTLGDKAFETAFTLAGIPPPKKADGTFDVDAARPIASAYREYNAKINRLGALTAPHSKQTYKSKTANGEVVTTADLNVLGQPILATDQAELAKLQSAGFTGFLANRNLVTPTAMPSAAAPEVTFEDAAPQPKAVTGPAKDFSSLIQPKGATSAVPILGQPFSGQPGQVTSIEEAPSKVSTEKIPTENQGRALLALPRFAEANTALQELQKGGYDPTSWKSWVDGKMPEVLKSGNRKEYETAIAAWSQGLLRLESGAAISIKEQLGYEKAFFPQVGDTPRVVQQKESLRHAVEETVAQVGSAGNIPPEIKQRADDLFNQALVNAGGKPLAPASAGTPAKVLSTGRKVGVTASGQFYTLP